MPKGTVLIISYKLDYSLQFFYLQVQRESPSTVTPFIPIRGVEPSRKIWSDTRDA
jgi:hypothetical protein